MTTVKSSRLLMAPRLSGNSYGIALIESTVSLALVALMLSGLFAANAHFMRLLQQGKEGTYATQMLQERVEQLRTALWDSVTIPAEITNVARPATATSVNLPGVTETITVRPLIAATTTPIVCRRTPNGVVSATGSSFVLEKSVKVVVRVEWNNRGRPRVREVATVLTNGGI